ncbi:MAG TPA: nuclear transport factor 2 family protein [Gemmatimonadaceae bacterium]|jgi:hypothetical protein
MLTRLLPTLAILGALIAGSSIATAAITRARQPPTPRSSIASTDSLEQTLEAAERQSWVAWQHRDGSYFQNFLADDHVEVGINGLATKAQVVAFVGSPACVVTSYAVDHFRLTRFDENTALLTYHAEQNTMCGTTRAPSPAWVSSLFVRRGGKWMNALYQQTKEQ